MLILELLFASFILSLITAQFAAVGPRRAPMSQHRASELLKHGCRFITTPAYTPAGAFA